MGKGLGMWRRGAPLCPIFLVKKGCDHVLWRFKKALHLFLRLSSESQGGQGKGGNPFKCFRKRTGKPGPAIIWQIGEGVSNLQRNRVRRGGREEAINESRKNVKRGR